MPIKISLSVKRFVLIVLIIVNAAFINAALTGVPVGEKRINCNIHEGVCTQNLPNLKVTLGISPKPVTAMQDLWFHLKLAGEIPDKAPYIDLGMPGMKMGLNRVMLKIVGQNLYKGKGVIVRCPSGQKIWRATVTIPAKGTVNFIFDVIY
ncbi:hypothetical protein ACFL0M_13505 [Thermodesulfobacteriota bacterium]